MTTTPKRSPSKTARAAALPTPASAPADERKPFLRFYHAESLRDKTLAVLHRVEGDDDPTEHSAALADLVVELTQCGMDYYFLQQLKRAKAGFIVEQSASISLGCALKVIGPVIRNIIGRMAAPQLISVCGSIRHLMA